MVGSLNDLFDLYRRCAEHRLEMTLFCTEDRCSREICSRCYLGEHKLHNVIDIDEEKEKCEKFVAEINKLVDMGNTELAEGKRKVVDHCRTEMQKLEAFKQHAFNSIDLFVNNKRAQILQNRHNGLRYIEALKANLDNAKQQVSASDMNSRAGNSQRLNAHQSERLLHSVLLKLQHVQRTGVRTTTYTYSGINRMLTSQLTDIDHSKPLTIAIPLNQLPDSEEMDDIEVTIHST